MTSYPLRKVRRKIHHKKWEKPHQKYVLTHLSKSQNRAKRMSRRQLIKKIFYLSLLLIIHCDVTHDGNMAYQIKVLNRRVAVAKRKCNLRKDASPWHAWFSAVEQSQWIEYEHIPAECLPCSCFHRTSQIRIPLVGLSRHKFTKNGAFNRQNQYLCMLI